MNNAMLFTLIALTSTACSTVSSSYTRERAPAQEIVWKFDGSFTPTQGGRELDGYSELAEATACVPEASSEASAAARWNTFGWTSLGIGLAGTLGGSGAMVGGILQDDINSDMLIAGGITAAGSMIVMLIGAVAHQAAIPNALDAVNIYNDELETRDTCR